ncbi:MAG: DUF2085 domain-containing protein [Candidatus Thorarchaeota archaeon]|nr:DUF2085 domain-containing protein [Candidatus Thorarchaeota archaeon]
MSSETESDVHPDALSTSEEDDIDRTGDFANGLQMLLSHHPPSMYGHCLRVSIMGRSLYLCGRCSGIYGGLGLGLLFLFIFQVQLTPEWFWFFLSVALGFTTVIDWMSQRLTPRKTTNFVRASTGFLSGLALAIIFYLGNLAYMLVALAVMSASIGIVGLVENRRRTAYYKEIQAEIESSPEASTS